MDVISIRDNKGVSDQKLVGSFCGVEVDDWVLFSRRHKRQARILGKLILKKKNFVYSIGILVDIFIEKDSEILASSEEIKIFTGESKNSSVCGFSGDIAFLLNIMEIFHMENWKRLSILILDSVSHKSWKVIINFEISVDINIEEVNFSFIGTTSDLGGSYKKKLSISLLNYLD